MVTRTLLGFLFIATCTIDVSAQKDNAPFTILIATPDSARVDDDTEEMFFRKYPFRKVIKGNYFHPLVMR